MQDACEFNGLDVMLSEDKNIPTTFTCKMNVVASNSSFWENSSKCQKNTNVDAILIGLFSFILR